MATPAGPGQLSSKQDGERQDRTCVVVSDPGPDAKALEEALSSVAAAVELFAPADVGGQLWRAVGPRLLIACGGEGVTAVMPWMALLQSTPDTATLALLDGSRTEVMALLERFDLWMPARTPPAIVAAQVVAQWSLMERQARLGGPRQISGYNLVIDLTREEALNGEAERIPLTPSEFRLLAVLAVQPGRVVDFWQLGTGLPGRFRDADDAYNSVKVHIGRLRQKLARATGWDGHLVSVRGRGFLFERRRPAPTPTTAVPELPELINDAPLAGATSASLSILRLGGDE